MDTSDLLAQLQRRIADTTRDRDRLAEAVVALEDAIARLTGDEAVVNRLRSWFEPQSDASAAEGASPPSSGAAAIDPSVSIAWPMEAEFTLPEKRKGLKAWSHSKLEAAAWYIETLKKMDQEGSATARSLGVEMAVDGAVFSLCAAFEAMICALTRAVERAAEIPKDHRTPLHLASWSKLAAASKVFDIDLASNLSVSDALVGEHAEEPQGFMAQLLVLRRDLALHDLISNAADSPDGARRIEVPGRGPLPLVDYLTMTLELTGELLETIEHDIADAKSGRLYIAALDELRQRAEQGIEDLLPPEPSSTP